MKKTLLYLIILFAAAISAFASEDKPYITAEVKQYRSYAVVSVDFNNIPDGSRILTAKYKDGMLSDIDTKAEWDETEIFTVCNDTDTVKIFVWENLRNLAPVTECAVIKLSPWETPAPPSESDMKTAELLKALLSGKNKNVTIYETEEKETRAIIWTKGITPPLMSDFVKEVEITDPSYTFYYASPGSGSNWYDVNKSNFQQDGADRNMCYAAVSANQLHWWFECNRENIDKYISIAEKAGSADAVKIAGLNDLRAPYDSRSDSGIYTLFRNYFQSPIAAYNADVLNDFIINGYRVNSDGKINTPDFYVSDPRGGFLFDVFGKNTLTDRIYVGRYD